MSGYYRIQHKHNDLAILEIVGWKGKSVAIHPKRIARMIEDIEAIQPYVGGEGQHLIHLFWEELSSLRSACLTEDMVNTEKRGPDNPRPGGTSGTSDAETSAPPEASGDS